MSHVEFTKEMKKTHKILVPMMLPIHFQFLQNILCKEGYNVEILQTEGQQIIDEGLKNVHNDTCYPALLVIGQMIDALKSGKYDTDHIALADHTDRRRMPCFQLHPPAAQGAGTGRL